MERGAKSPEQKSWPKMFLQEPPSIRVVEDGDPGATLIWGWVKTYYYQMTGGINIH
jgi:hypothetical protein